MILVVVVSHSEPVFWGKGSINANKQINKFLGKNVWEKTILHIPQSQAK